MGDRKRTDDFSDLVQAATRAIASALADGDGHHPPGSWQQETFGNQMNHGRDHINALDMGVGWNSAHPESDDDLSHAICRLSIAYALRERMK